jgi:glutathione S-transferase
MTENDYIAEYIKEKYPRLLGVDFAFWKMIRLIGSAVKDIAKIFSEATPEEIEEFYKEHEEEIGELPEDEEE